MTFKLNELRDNPGARKGRMRVGRGIGSGKGTGIVAEFVQFESHDALAFALVALLLLSP